MDKYNLCIARTKKIVSSSKSLEEIRKEKDTLEKISKIDGYGQEYLIYTDDGDLII